MTINTMPIIHTVEGPVQGAIDRGAVAYMGIPYAAPPVGDLRWRPPQQPPRPVTPWEEVRQSESYEGLKSCWQNREVCTAVGGGDPDPMDEDCLYLNVWTPQGATDTSKLPVMVWIHGGAYIMGAGKLPVYHGAPLVSRGAILVTLNYRLGALGFFAHDALDKEIPEGQPRVNNFGLLDQIAALEWVQRNIDKFGGDPGNVTIFGQSAGSRSVLALFTSPLVIQRDKPLFHRGIAQSVYRFPEATQAQAHTRGANLAKLLGLEGADVTAQQLRDVPARKLMNIDKEFDPKGTSNAPVPISGDVVLPNAAGVFDSFLKGEQAALPLIIGNTSDDGSVVLDTPGVTEELMLSLAAGVFPSLRPVQQFYPELAEQDELTASLKKQLGRRVARDSCFTVMTYKLAEAHSKHKDTPPTWRYYFDYTAENLRPEVTEGTRHGDDVIFTMNTGDIAPPALPSAPLVPVEFTEKDRAVANRVSEYWFEFARTGTPSSAAGPAWPQHAEGQDKTLLLGQSIEVRTDFMTEHYGEPQKDNMSAFEDFGKAVDRTMASLG